MKTLNRFRFSSTWTLFAIIFILTTTMVVFSKEGEEASETPYMESYTGADADLIGSDQCLLCHEDKLPETAFTHLSLIDKNRDDANYGYGCEACHGPGGNHYGESAGILNFADMESDDITAQCSQCHASLRTFDENNWYLSEHYFSDVTCLDCHSGHTDNKKFLDHEEEIELCYSCHMDKRAEFNMRSHHPVDEGQLNCTSCHNPMSGEFDYHLINEGDDLCFTCHGDLQGPFIFDMGISTAEGGDGCITCHFVHGGNADKLLRYPNNVCLQCHTDLTSEEHFQGACWTSGCHTQVHGSNSHPLFFN